MRRSIPHRMAIVSPAGRRSFGELNARANQLACALRTAGVTPGDGIALLVGNRPEFVETHQAALRIGARVTPINWHLGPDEVAYVVDDSEAIAFVAEAAFAPAAASAARRAARLRLRLAVGGEIDGFAAYDAVLAASSGRRPGGSDSGLFHALHLRHHRPSERGLPPADRHRDGDGWRTCGNRLPSGQTRTPSSSPDLSITLRHWPPMSSP